MKASRSDSSRTFDLLNYYVNAKEPGTLYQISHKKRLMAWSALNMAAKNLLKRNLIKKDPATSRQRGRNAAVYSPTFKGLLVFLENSECLLEGPSRQSRELERVLERNGKRLDYPVFKHFSSFNLPPELYLTLITIAKETLSSPFLPQSHSTQLFEAIERSREESNELEKKVTEYDQDIVLRESIQRKKREMIDNQQLLDAMSERENEALKEEFFLKLLERVPAIKAPNKELNAYTINLLEKKERELELLRDRLEKGLSNFRTGELSSG